VSDFLLRSLMFVPGHNERLIRSAAQSGADVLLLDIEDSVQPEEYKAVARDTIERWVHGGALSSFKIFPRVNDRESGHLLRDVHQLTIPGVDGFVYPKARRGEDVYFFSKLLETIEYEKGLPVNGFKIIPLIETASAVLHAQEICEASTRVVGIAFGCEDFVADLGGLHDAEAKSLFTARSLIAMAARASNVAPIDTVHINVHDLQELERNLELAKVLGFEGMLILHPKEIELAHRYFSPSPEEIDDARETLRLAEEARELGKGVAVLDQRFVGPPMVRHAQNVLAKAQKIARVQSLRTGGSAS
jgi:citrate lyase subunit beta / citryl-CoA lyase